MVGDEKKQEDKMEAFIDTLLSPTAKKALMLAVGEEYDVFERTFIKLKNAGEINAFANNRPPLRLDQSECLGHIAKTLYKFWNQNTTSCTNFDHTNDTEETV